MSQSGADWCQILGHLHNCSLVLEPGHDVASINHEHSVIDICIQTEKYRITPVSLERSLASELSKQPSMTDACGGPSMLTLSDKR